MPNNGDSPSGVHPHVQVDRVGNEVHLWVKGKVHIMDKTEAKALAAALTETPPPVEEPTPSEPTPPPAEPENAPAT